VLEVGYDHRGLRRDRSADEQPVARLHQPGEWRHRQGDLDLARAVEDDAHRALVVVVTDQHDRATEVRVQQGRSSDQQVSAQRFHGPIMARTTGPRAA
jgi:hypothetical protein